MENRRRRTPPRHRAAREAQQTAEDEIEQLWLRLNRPSADRLYTALQRRGLVARLKGQMYNPPLQSYVHQLTSRPEKQVFRTGPQYKGRVTAVDKDSRWQCDIIDNIRDPAQQGNKTYR